MKNIRSYYPEKYNKEGYTKVAENIFKTTTPPEWEEDVTSFKQIEDEELLKALREITDWEECDDDVALDMLFTTYNGKKYYKEAENESGVFYEEDMSNKSGRTIYVTSLVFEPEPELGENAPTDPTPSQSPLEQLEDKFNCFCPDGYRDENTADATNSYIEFASTEQKNIEDLLTILGKHVCW